MEDKKQVAKIKDVDSAKLATGIKLEMELPRDEKKSVIDATLKVRRTASGYRPGASTRKFASVSTIDLEKRPAYYAKKFPKLQKKMKISAKQLEALNNSTLTEIEQAYANS